MKPTKLVAAMVAVTVLTVGLAALAPTASAADPDLIESGDECDTAPPLGSGAAGSVDPVDRSDFYRVAGPSDVTVTNPVPLHAIWVLVHDGDCFDTVEETSLLGPGQSIETVPDGGVLEIRTFFGPGAYTVTRGAAGVGSEAPLEL